MKFVVISGSRNQKGQTAKVIDALIQGIENKGTKTELIFLPQMKVERCRQCEDHGWGICRSEGKCVIKDDFVSIVDKIKNSDAVVFATSVYYSDISESLRAFLDRLRRICTHEKGREKISGKKAIGICVAGGGGGGAPSCTVSMEKVLGNCGFDVVDVIPARRQNLDVKIEVLKIVGKWLANSIANSKK